MLRQPSIEAMRKFGYLGLVGFIVFFQLIHRISSQPAVKEDDIRCLNITHNQLKDPQDYLYSWKFDSSGHGFTCNFLGITCWHNDDDKVLSLSLQGLGLQGGFPSGLKYCGSMTSLVLSQNSLTGNIPKELCHWLPYLVIIDLSHNQFTGPIPSQLYNCRYLNVLRLNGNQLTGKIPWQLAQLQRLKEFNVANNRLSGPMPAYFSNWTASGFQNNPGLCGPPLTKTCSKILPSISL